MVELPSPHRCRHGETRATGDAGVCRHGRRRLSARAAKQLFRVSGCGAVRGRRVGDGGYGAGRGLIDQPRPWSAPHSCVGVGTPRSSLSHASPGAGIGAWPAQMRFTDPGGAGGGAAHGWTWCRGRGRDARCSGNMGRTSSRGVTAWTFIDCRRQPEMFHVKHRARAARPGQMRLRSAAASSIATGSQRDRDHR